MSRNDQQEAFLALTFVVIVIVLITCKESGPAIVAVGLLILAYREWQRRHEVEAPQAAPPVQEGFNTYLPGAPAPYAAAAPPVTGTEVVTRYPGAIDVDEYDSDAEFGHRDRTAGDNDHAPVGNPFVRSRVTAPASADACVDDEANDDEIEGDERIAYQGLARNDPERVIAGTMNRRREFDPYVREELEETEDLRWWGRHEV